MRACPKCGAEYADDVKFCPKDAAELPAVGAVPVRGWTSVLQTVNSEGAPTGAAEPKKAEDKPAQAAQEVPTRGWTSVLQTVNSEGAPSTDAEAQKAPAPAQAVPTRGWTDVMAAVTPESLEKAAPAADKPKPAEGVVPTRGWTDVMAAVTPEMVAQLTGSPPPDAPPEEQAQKAVSEAPAPAADKPKPAEGVVPTRGWTDVMAVVTPEMAAQLTEDPPPDAATSPAAEPPAATASPAAMPHAPAPAPTPPSEPAYEETQPTTRGGARITLVIAGVIVGAALMVVVVWLLSHAR